MDTLYMIMGIVSAMMLYDAIKYVIVRLQRRWGENPSDAKYGGRR